VNSVFVLFYVLFVSIVLFYVFFVSKCVLYYCHQVATQLQLYHIDNLIKMRGIGNFRKLVTKSGFEQDTYHTRIQSNVRVSEGLLI